MSQRVIETVTFRLKPSIDREAFLESALAINDYVATCPGFVARRLSCTNEGSWTEHIEWETMSDAKAAADGIGLRPGNRAFLEAIDGSTVNVRHSALQVSVG